MIILYISVYFTYGLKLLITFSLTSLLICNNVFLQVDKIKNDGESDIYIYLYFLCHILFITLTC